MANPWFRLYSEWAKDPKVQSMDETFQRRYIMFLCLRCNEELTELDDDELAFALHITLDELTETKELFIKKGFIDSDLNIIAWDKRQFQSDLSTQRVKEFRERQKGNGKSPPPKGGNGMKRPCNVSETPPDTDTDTDTDKKKEGTNVPLSGKPDEKETELKTESTETAIPRLKHPWQNPDLTDEERWALAPLIYRAEKIIAYLNKQTGSRFYALHPGGKETETAKIIICRIKQGWYWDDFCDVIDSKTREWKGTDREIYLRPKTLFAATNFENYVGQAKR